MSNIFNISRNLGLFITLSLVVFILSKHTSMCGREEDLQQTLPNKEAASDNNNFT